MGRLGEALAAVTRHEAELGVALDVGCHVEEGGGRHETASNDQTKYHISISSTFAMHNQSFDEARRCPTRQILYEQPTDSALISS